MTHLELLREGFRISKSGYGGVLGNGNIVDRRYHPKAIPIAKNSMFDVPEPIAIPAEGEAGAKG